MRSCFRYCVFIVFTNIFKKNCSSTMLLWRMSSSGWAVYKPPQLLLGVTCRHYGYIHVEKKKPPHILGPGYVWRKCHLVRPTTEITFPLTKFRWLTKSVLVNGLPDAINSLHPPEDDVINDFEERACDYLAYHVRKPHNRRGPYNQETVEGLIQSCLSSVWPLADDYRHLRSSHMTVKPNIECYWRRFGQNYISQTQPMYVMHTNMALGLFCKSDFVGDGLVDAKYLPPHLGLFRRSFDQILPFGGSRNFSALSMAHTVFMINQKDQESENLLTHGLMQLFSQSAAEAVQNGFKIDQDLPLPLVSQGIVTDGQKFTFVCFQLNTLDFREESEAGKCNVFWGGPTLKLYDNLNVGHGLENLNRSCVEMIFKFLLHEPLRRRLRQFGGRSRAMPLHKMATDGQQLSPVTREEWKDMHFSLNRLAIVN